MHMNPKEENEKLIAQNTQLKKENGEILVSINTSRLVLETAKKQETEGYAVLRELSEAVEEALTNAKLAKKEAENAIVELSKLEIEKQKLELDIETLKKDIVTASDKAKKEASDLTESIQVSTVVKQTELSGLISKINTEKINLGSIKKDIETLQEDITNRTAFYDELSAKCVLKSEELEDIENKIAEATAKLEKSTQILNDTTASTQAYEDRKAGLIEDMSVLNEAIVEKQKEIIDISAEITEMHEKRDTAIAEFKASESRIFDLVRREEALTERELYAKERFKVAGLEY
jgi:chromosome segregation ATPase